MQGTHQPSSLNCYCTNQRYAHSLYKFGTSGRQANGGFAKARIDRWGTSPGRPETMELISHARATLQMCARPDTNLLQQINCLREHEGNPSGQQVGVWQCVAHDTLKCGRDNWTDPANTKIGNKIMSIHRQLPCHRSRRGRLLSSCQMATRAPQEAPSIARH